MATAPLQPARGQRLRSAGVGANTLSPEKLLKGIDEGKGRLKIKSGHVRFETKGESVDSKPPPPVLLLLSGKVPGWGGREEGTLWLPFPRTLTPVNISCLFCLYSQGAWF